MPDRRIPERESSPQSANLGSESDLGELAALFAGQGGGNLSAEVSADLALEIVLNQIVEQVCLATGATGAAIILERDGEMVCRASSGVNAPELGARLGGESGLTAECIRTRQVQRCEDAQADPRVDAEASRSLGVRSVIILPLLWAGGLAGLLEVFSSRPGAFGERDELTLETLAQRVLKNLERARETSSASNIAAAVAAIPGASAVVIAADGLESQSASSETSLNSDPKRRDPRRDEVFAQQVGRGPRAGIDVVTWALGAAVVASAVLLATLVGLRLSGQRTAGVQGTESALGRAGGEQSRAAQDGSQRDGAGQIAGELGSNAVSLSPSSKAGNSTVAVSEKKVGGVAGNPAERSHETLPPAGSLLVYEDGKEVFRMLPSANGTEVRKGEGGVQQASAVEPEGVGVVSPEVAAGSLLHRVEPEYPEEARRQQVQGAVALDVRIGRDGVVQNVKVISGHRLLADAAIAAVKQWRFKPRVVRGQAVEMETRVTLSFKMPE